MNNDVQMTDVLYWPSGVRALWVFGAEYGPALQFLLGTDFDIIEVPAGMSEAAVGSLVELESGERATRVPVADAAIAEGIDVVAVMREAHSLEPACCFDKPLHELSDVSRAARVTWSACWDRIDAHQRVTEALDPQTR